MFAVLAEADTIVSAAAILEAEFGVPRIRIERDLLELCAALCDRGLLELDDAKRRELPGTLHYRAFAIPLRSSFPLPGLAPAAADAEALSLQLAPGSQIQRLWSGANGGPVWTTAIDGRPYTMTLGTEGDYLMAYAR